MPPGLTESHGPRATNSLVVGVSKGPARAVHEFTRKGRTLKVTVQEIVAAENAGYMFIFGDSEPANGWLVRIHSECLYGEVLGSDSCDCGPELDLAMDLIYRMRSGILIYLEQEGRGSGLLAKARGYSHSQQNNVDSFASFEALGFPPDCRTYDSAALSLKALGLERVRLLTNNPRKVVALKMHGLDVDRVRLWTKPRGPAAAAYLESKRRQRYSTQSKEWSPKHRLGSPTMWTWLAGIKKSLAVIVGISAGAAVWWGNRDLMCATTMGILVGSLARKISRRSQPISSLLIAIWDCHRGGGQFALATVLLVKNTLLRGVTPIRRSASTTRPHAQATRVAMAGTSLRD
ncbi:GTP cyclohydrolase II [Nocardia sp. NPDC051030]|uniref:GTP cyclohydrolase II n=1 Tax=Nocardia sp. NPDC051030 TaxID=3155162 RepID=UPI00343B2569